jgi:hypothetical protein
MIAEKIAHFITAMNEMSIAEREAEYREIVSLQENMTETEIAELTRQAPDLMQKLLESTRQLRIQLQHMNQSNAAA